MAEKSSHGIDTPERALLSLFKKPALDFSRRLRTCLDNDPAYLEDHRREVVVELSQHLASVGLVLDASTREEDLLHLVREVVVRLRSYEKARGGNGNVR